MLQARFLFAQEHGVLKEGRHYFLSFQIILSYNRFDIDWIKFG